MAIFKYILSIGIMIAFVGCSNRTDPIFARETLIKATKSTEVVNISAARDPNWTFLVRMPDSTIKIFIMNGSYWDGGDGDTVSSATIFDKQ